MLCAPFPASSASVVSMAGTDVTAEDKALAGCTVPCAGPSQRDSGSLPHTACCKDRCHSRCRRSSHTPGHRCHTQRRACTGWLGSAAGAPRAPRCLLSGRPGHRPGATHSNSSCGLDTRTCPSRRTGRKRRSPPRSGRSETPRT